MQADGLYLVLPQERLLKILNNSGVPKKTWRDQIFDCDDFAMVFKAEVGKWGDKTFKADKFAILCGIMFGTKGKEGHAYNWTLDSKDLNTVIFFEPQTGEFSRNAWNWKAYFGLF
ncbi:hypothetical protein DFH07DRAFT_969990 [Mycena maculata]|uniref:Agglutinin C-terminal domain-containing protein n=1 Tax=Mycena maculata TaxID=230809 RepID=A0AAD7MQZ0_9AGAR|nr:hypothetical protein DFH07DRAFT_969990 [Mycena maculata]